MNNILPNNNDWPKQLYRSLPLTKMLQEQKICLKEELFPLKHFNYILEIFLAGNMKAATLELTFSIASRFKRKNQSVIPSLQLLLLVSIFIASKLLQKNPLSLNELHSISNHCYTNKDIYRLEAHILEDLNFQFFQGTLLNYQIKVIITLMSIFMDESHKLELIADQVHIVLLQYLYTKPNIIDHKYEHMLGIAIVHIALIICTQCAGRLPPTLYILSLMNIDESELNNVVESLMKVVLGKQIVNELGI